MKRKSKQQVDNLVPNNPEYDRRIQDQSDKKAEQEFNRNTLYDESSSFLSRILEVYRNKYGYRTTVSGNRVPFDEPLERDSDEIRKHNAAISKQIKRRKDGKERLRQLNKVPIRKDGSKLFEEFMREAKEAMKSEFDDSDLIRIFKAAKNLNYPDWLIFVNRMYSVR
jgi:hypothetical protein